MAEIHSIRREQIPQLVTLISEFSVFEKMEHVCHVSDRSLDEALFGDAAFAGCLVAENEGVCVGYAFYYPVFRTFSSVPAMYLEDLYVRSELRGAGLGTKLLEAVSREAAARGIRRVDLQALAWNGPAIGFYESLGAEKDEGNIDLRISGAAFDRLASE